ncbi:MAG TPA: YaiO family outer membrane beta-barrel protein [Chryseosolibacter sp.]
MKLLFRLLIVLSLMPWQVAAQDWKNLGTDELFDLARQRAYNGKREEAREMLKFILEKSPDYADARVLLGRTYAWEGQYDNARIEFEKVIQKTDYLDAFNAYADVEIWSESYQNGLVIVQRGLTSFPNDEDLLYKKAKILNEVGKQQEAVLVLNNLLLINPSDSKAIALLKDIRLSRMRYTAGISYGIDLFNRTFDPAHYTSVQLGRTNRWGSLIGRLNYAHRFGLNGVQPEIDAYPRIVDGVYAYVNYGFSSTDLFPKHRAGLELYTKLPKSFEASAGLRYLFFDEATKVTIYTGSIGWYVGNYWLSIRPYVTPDKIASTAVSGSLAVRRYFSDPETYLGISGGVGFSPDIRRIQDATGLSNDEIYLLHAQRAGLAFQKLMKANFIFNASADFARQELIFDQGNYVQIASLSVGLKKKF